MRSPLKMYIMLLLDFWSKVYKAATCSIWVIFFIILNVSLSFKLLLGENLFQTKKKISVDLNEGNQDAIDFGSSWKSIEDLVLLFGALVT